MIKKLMWSLVFVATTAMGADIEIIQLQHMLPYGIFGLIERVKIAAFSTDSFINNGLKEESVIQWDDLTDALNVIVVQLMPIELTDAYYRCIKELDATRLYVQDAIRALYVGNPVHLATAQRHWRNMHALQERMFQEIRKTTKPGAEWIATITSPILTREHAALLKDFKSLVKQAEKEHAPLQEKEVRGLLKLHHITTKMQVKILIDNLEQYCYRKQKDTVYARMLIKELSFLYTGILSSYDISVLANTQDKMHTILFAQAGAYENILHQIVREIQHA